ncbi:LysR substrate-binding domain-containing protein [Cupriavidus lacunae]|uniref:LysR family transcriptional regulator n=1 Tax=Cupriavidus lacunae TaxID=2666307 RepID=A0A370NLP9_9BURK|nr:LysR substrate-binding domain-containing protein [Cupriavidus lacunae]RDK06514.1 LysR family transcriptional regulator [Cupriavidus lacunae]
MELRHLRYFVAAAEEEHFGRASDRLFVTRPAVSQIIADLEDELGVELFERQPHKVKLTAAGQALLPRLQSIMSDLSQAVTLAKQVGEGKVGGLSIGYGSLTLYHPLFRAAIKRFLEYHPNVALTLVEMPTSEQVKAVLEGRIQAGFMHFGPDAGAPRKQRKGIVQAEGKASLERYVIQTGGLGVVVPADHPLAKRKAVSLSQLAGERFVVVPRSSVSPGYGPLFAFCQEAGFEPQVVQEVHSIASQMNLISVGVGIGLAVLGKDFTYPSGLAVIKLTDVNYRTNFQLCWMKGRIEPVLQQFIAVVQELSGANHGKAAASGAAADSH